MSRNPRIETMDPEWAWAPYQPDAQRPWNLSRAGHLFRRAAFGANYHQLQQALTCGPQPTIDRLLHPDAAEVAAFQRTYDQYEASADSSDSVGELRAWWLRRMLETPHPLLEKMTLFWHGHFAISNRRVKSPRLMRQHVGLLRAHALGRFPPLLQTVSHDPATLLGLDCQANRKSSPNKNYARRLLETFVLGPGNFSETDVREAARACTGWFVLRGEARFIGREHDSGPKSLLGQQGNFTDADVVRIVLQQPASPRLIIRRLYRWLVSDSDQPSDALLEPLAASFGRDFDMGQLVETVLRSNLFFCPAVYRQKVKSPVDLALGIIHAFESLVPTLRLGQDLAQLGQDLFQPPTIRGWVGGSHWINQATVLGRIHLAESLLSKTGPYANRLRPLELARKYARDEPESSGPFLADLLVQGDLPPGVLAELKKPATGTDTSGAADRAEQLRHSARRIVLLPEFQLA